jgi:hypothetical protein
MIKRVTHNEQMSVEEVQIIKPKSCTVCNGPLGLRGARGGPGGRGAPGHLAECGHIESRGPEGYRGPKNPPKKRELNK